MNNKKKNEGIGIMAIVLIVIIAVIGLYYHFSQRHYTKTNEENSINVPIESPAPLPDEPVKSNK